MFALLLSMPAVLPSHAQAPETKLPAGTDTTWPGVKLQVTKLIRIDATHLLAAINVEAGPSAGRVFLGDPPKVARPPPNASPEELSSPKYQPTPYSLKLAKLYDEGTKQVFNAAENLPDNPPSGPNEIIMILYPNCALQMGVLFPVPPPPPPLPDGTIPPQLATFLLPKAKKAIEHVVLPLPTEQAAPGTSGSPVPAR